MKITAKDFAAKYKEKHEVYHFLTHDCGVYLSGYDSMTVWHMRDLVAGKRRKIFGKDVCHMNVPQYDGLSIKNMLEYARPFP